MNPFINLTLHCGTPTTVNILKIVCYEPRFRSVKTKPDMTESYTYIVLSGDTVTRNVNEKYEEVHKLIQQFYTTTQND